jgi:Zn-dependent protease
MAKEGVLSTSIAQEIREKLRARVAAFACLGEWCVYTLFIAVTMACCIALVFWVLVVLRLAAAVFELVPRPPFN